MNKRVSDTMKSAVDEKELIQIEVVWRREGDLLMVRPDGDEISRERRTIAITPTLLHRPAIAATKAAVIIRISPLTLTSPLSPHQKLEPLLRHLPPSTKNYHHPESQDQLTLWHSCNNSYYTVKIVMVSHLYESISIANTKQVIISSGEL
jgi:hypothetical protein